MRAFPIHIAVYTIHQTRIIRDDGTPTVASRRLSKRQTASLVVDRWCMQRGDTYATQQICCRVEELITCVRFVCPLVSSRPGYVNDATSGLYVLVRLTNTRGWDYICFDGWVMVEGGFLWPNKLSWATRSGVVLLSARRGSCRRFHINMLLWRKIHLAICEKNWFRMWKEFLLFILEMRAIPQSKNINECYCCWSIDEHTLWEHKKRPRPVDTGCPRQTPAQPNNTMSPNKMIEIGAFSLAAGWLKSRLYSTTQIKYRIYGSNVTSCINRKRRSIDSGRARLVETACLVGLRSREKLFRISSRPPEIYSQLAAARLSICSVVYFKTEQKLSSRASAEHIFACIRASERTHIYQADPKHSSKWIWAKPERAANAQSYKAQNVWNKTVASESIWVCACVLVYAYHPLGSRRLLLCTNIFASCRLCVDGCLWAPRVLLRPPRHATRRTPWVFLYLMHYRFGMKTIRGTQTYTSPNRQTHTHTHMHQHISCKDRKIRQTNWRAL